MENCEYYENKHGGHWCNKYDKPCMVKISNLMCDYKHRLWVEQQLLAEQAKNKELENILNVLGGKTVAICEFDKPIEFWGAKDHLIASLQAKNKKLVETLGDIKKLKHKEMCCCDAVDNNITIIKLVKQALNEVNNAK